MKVDQLVAMHKHHPIEVVGDAVSGKPTTVREAVGSFVVWGGGMFLSMWLARWYTLRTLRKKGVVGV